MLTPAARSEALDRQFYVDELCGLDDGSLVIPLVWMKRHGILHADCHPVTQDYAESVR